MRSGATAIAALLIGSLLYWLFVARVAGVAEPWDAADYWRLWYPLSLGLAALAGGAWRRRGWLAGAIVTFAQLPVTWPGTGAGTRWMVGIVMATLLAAPAVALSALAGWLMMRARPA
jgi:hypothetical protein